MLAPESRASSARPVPTTLATVGQIMVRLLEMHGLDARGLLDSTDLIVVSDHGMAKVGPGRAIGVEQMIAPSIATVVSDGQSIGVQPLPGRATTRHVDLRLW